MDKKIKLMLTVLVSAILAGNAAFASTTLETGTESNYAGEERQQETTEDANLLTSEEDIEDWGDTIKEDETDFFSAEESQDEQIYDGELQFATGENEENSLDLILNTGYTIEEFERVVSSISTEIKLSSISEIELVHLVLPASMDKESFLNHDEIRPFIYAQGELPDISIPQEPINNFNLNESSLPEYSQYRSQMTDEEMFDAMAWHVDEITNNRMSLNIAQGNGTKIAVIDSGVDTEHPILAGKINSSDSRSYVTEEVGIGDSNGHGTGVAGIIAQVAPGAEMTIYKVIGAETGNSEWTISAVIQAANDGNNIINMSLGTYKCEDVESELLTIEAFERAIEYAETQDCLVVASAGNKTLNLDQYYETEHIKHLPGGIEGAITVSAINETSLASYSNFGSNIDFCAPGGDMVYVDGMLDLGQWIYCIYPTNMDNGLSSLGVPQGYSFNCGTSLAAPEVTAGLADILSYYLENEQDVSINQIVQDMMDGVDDIGAVGKDTFFGFGAIDIYNSLNAPN